MARATPRVQRELLHTRDSVPVIPVGLPKWFAWLAEHRVFAFTSPGGSFTARKERRAVGWYWYAYRRQRSILRSAYLGKTEELTLARLTEVAERLNAAPPSLEQATKVSEQSFLLATKMTPPVLHTSFIKRPRLIAYLRQHAACRLLLVTGPAGSGKTTLLSEWLRELSCPVAWVSLDEGDNDLARFWSYVLAALQKRSPGLALHMSTLLPALQAEGVEPFLIPLVNALATLPGEIVLVLDDYHVLTSQTVQESVAFLLEHAPEQLRLVIASRALPSLPLPRLRARRVLAELHFADLRFTWQETKELFRGFTDNSPTSEDLSRLLEYTEGWATGLSLAALALRDRQSKTADALTSQGDYQSIFEYLASEVLARQSEQVRDFLLHSSVLERFTGALCDAVTLQKQSESLLQRLEHENLFLYPLDEQRLWYRYHQLFSDFLRTRLEQISPGEAEILHSRAAAWYIQNGMPVEAIASALRAQNFTLAAHLIGEQGRNVLMRHEVLVLGTWLRALPEELVLGRPHLCVFASWVLLHTSQTEPIERYLAAAERGLDGDEMAENERLALCGEISAIRARVAIYQARIEQSIVLAHQALSWLAGDDLYLRGEVALSLGTASVVLGETRAAEDAYCEAIELSQRCGNLRATLLAMRSLALLHVDQGRLRQARKLYQDGLEHALQTGQENLPPVGFLHVGLGELFYEWNDLETAERHLREGIALGQRGGDVKIWLLGYVGLIHTTWARGDHERARLLFAEAERLARQASFTRGIAWLKEVHMHLSFLQGDLTPLQNWAQECDLDPAGEPDAPHEYAYYQLALALIACGEPDLALPILLRLLDRVEQAGRTGHKITLFLGLARAYELCGEIHQALDALAQALSLAEPQGYVRTFLDAGVQVADLLETLRRSSQQGTQPARSCSPGYLDRLLSTFRRAPAGQDHHETAGSLAERLSRRELEVLRLLAAGQSNAEIAGTLIIGLNTVKTHLKNIYGKLEVRNRTQAIARARFLQLL